MVPVLRPRALPNRFARATSAGHSRAAAAERGWALSLLLIGGLASCSAAPAAAQGVPPAVAPDRLAEWYPELPKDAARADLERAVLARLAAEGPDAARAEMHAAIEAGEWEHARDLLSVLVARGEIERGAKLLASGDAAAALSVLDRALGMFEHAPRDPEGRLLRAEAALRVGREQGERELLESALADFVAVAADVPSSEAQLGASRAARALGRNDAALDHARIGMEVRRSAVNARAVLPGTPIAQRIWAEASIETFRTADAADRGSAWALSYFDEARGALEALAGRAPADPWTWNELARLHALGGAHAEAERVALLGLSIAPCDAALCATLAEAVEARGGHAARIAVFESMAARDADCALAHWHPAEARWSDAVERYVAGEDVRALFADAERGFARCRRLEPGYDRACREHEATCRAGIGWCAWRAGEIEAAQSAFLSIEELYAGAITTEVPQKLGPAVLGLDLVGAAYAKRGADAAGPAAIDDLERAGRVYEFLRRAQPEDVRWANNAGFFHRDTAIALRDRARALFEADPAKLAEANRMIARAKELMEQSFAAYVEAARLAPDDVRIVNDTALILVYYLQRDAARARALLESARATGAARLPDLRARANEDGLTEKERGARRLALEELENGLGDVYQNLGVLALTLDGDAKAALPWLEQCLVTGPDPREEVRGERGYLQRCKDALEQGANPRVTVEHRWDAPLAPVHR
ncbi:MAG: hypothetical protein HZA53_14580 [Planctomycetes bacterium]|nr:hypothetical protein [Planctomycetota bacterium]